jgi:lipid-binding SYLF domain-containing protein
MNRAPTLSRMSIVLALAWLVSSAVPSAIGQASVEDEILHDATLVFRHAMSPPAAIPPSVIAQARAIAVVPRAQRDGGLYYGVGVLSGRSGFDGWTPPAVVSFQGELPLQLESNQVDFVVIALTSRGIDYLTQPEYAALLSDPIAAGPLKTPALTRADLVAYLRFSLMFAGVTIANWEMRDAPAANERLYGRAYSTDDILGGKGFFHLPKPARAWRDALVSAMRETS